MYRHIEKDEKKLTDEEIVKALEYCEKNEGCIGGVCPFYSADCECVKPALDLIHRQKAEIERLTEENGQLKGYNSGLEYELELKQKRVDELTAFKDEAISMSLYGKGRKDGEEVGYKQAIKNIAKEVE